MSPFSKIAILTVKQLSVVSPRPSKVAPRKEVLTRLGIVIPVSVGQANGVHVCMGQKIKPTLGYFGHV